MLDETARTAIGLRELRRHILGKMKGVSIDDARFGVKAIGNDGAESLVAPCVYPARRRTEIPVVD
jgi:hypothetical protein